MKTVRISFQDFLKMNKLNKQWKKDLLDTHYELGKDDANVKTVNHEFLIEKHTEPWLHHNIEEDCEEMLQDYYKRRNETQNFTVKDDIVTESFGPIEAIKNKLMTPDLKTTNKLDDGEEKMTTLKFTRTNFKLGHLEELKKVKSKTSTNFFKPKVYISVFI